MTTLTELCAAHGVPRSTVSYRMKKFGMSLEDALAGKLAIKSERSAPSKGNTDFPCDGCETRNNCRNIGMACADFADWSDCRRQRGDRMPSKLIYQQVAERGGRAA